MRKNKKLMVFLIIFILGAVMALAGFADTKLLMSGDKINLNTAQMGDLDNPAIIEGEIDFVYGPFAILEQTEKTYGITTKKTETNFYIIGNFSDDMYAEWENGTDEAAELDYFYVVLATSNKDKQAELDKAYDKWYSYLANIYNAEAANEQYGGNFQYDGEPPKVSVQFKGKTVEQMSDPEYEQYLNEAMEDLGLESGDIAFLEIREGEVKKTTTYAIFFGGIALAVIGLIGAIASIISAAKKKKQAKEFDEAYGEF